MKRIFTIAAALLMTASVWAQSPEKMSYQAVIRDASNALVATQAVGMQISILQITATGIAVYVETQNPTTNVNGLVSLEIGTGTTTDNFATIDWSAGPYFIKTETDPTGGTTYTITGTSQLMSVPYALHAKTADSIVGGINETDPIFGVSVANGITAADTANWNNHIVDTDTQLDSAGIVALGFTTGTQGPTGATGAAGINGTNGTNGIDGAVGATGAVGPQGPVGAVGSTGTNGLDGADGIVGAVGATGPAGTNGTNGTNGNDGAVGATGAASTVAGPQGPTGAIGAVGATGPAGTNGTNGNDGATGATGAASTVAGPQGPPGAAGVAGPFHLGKDTLGGIVYYIYIGSDGNQHGLIVNKTESIAVWQATATLTNANRAEDGSFNTSLMTSSPAATYVTGLGAGWYLPSIHELFLLYYNVITTNQALRTGGFTLLTTSANYWSSTEYDRSTAYVFLFGSGGYVIIKYSGEIVRAVRAF
jgi:hypothetical protein